MLLEKNHELLLKGHLPMVLLLVLDLRHCLVQSRHAHAEGTVFDLPAEVSMLGESFMHPFGGAALEELHRFGNGKS